MCNRIAGWLQTKSVQPENCIWWPGEEEPDLIAGSGTLERKDILAPKGFWLGETKSGKALFDPENRHVTISVDLAGKVRGYYSLENALNGFKSYVKIKWA